MQQHNAHQVGPHTQKKKVIAHSRMGLFGTMGSRHKVHIFVVYGSISQDKEVNLEENHRRNTNNDQPPKDYQSKSMNN
jgi:hypothetical protein